MPTMRSPERMPAFEAGAHIAVRTPSGAVRSYSLNNDDAETHRYVISVKREEGGRGGSVSLHAATKLGDALTVSVPKSTYAFKEGPKYLLIAGGIGITPIISMFRRLVRQNVSDVTLIYCTRVPEETAYWNELQQEPYRKHVRLHHSGHASGARFDFWPFFEKPDETQIYYCGPAAMMDAIHAMSIHWPRKSLHFESFSGAAAGDDKPFKVRRAGTDMVFDIPSGKTVVEVLRDAGLKPASSCESGTCGTCRVRLIDGVPEHRDLVLSEDEKTDFFMPCVSRAYGGEITLEF